MESFAYQYTGDPALYAADPYRSSDHDPLLLGSTSVPTTCQGLTPTIVGTPGDDVLRGGNGRDVIVGLGGDDVIHRRQRRRRALRRRRRGPRSPAATATTSCWGEAGDDVLAGDNGSDRLHGGEGEDVLRQGNGKGVQDPGGSAS